MTVYCLFYTVGTLLLVLYWFLLLVLYWYGQSYRIKTYMFKNSFKFFNFSTLVLGVIWGNNGNEYLNSFVIGT